MFVFDVRYPLPARLRFCPFRDIVTELDFRSTVKAMIGLFEEVVSRVWVRWWWWCRSGQKREDIGFRCCVASRADTEASTLWMLTH